MSTLYGDFIKMSNIYKGKLKFYKRAKGFGYIEYFDGNEKRSIYTHVSQFVNGVRSINVGQHYKFKIGENDRGKIATDVEVLNAKAKTNTRAVSDKTV